MKVRGKAPRESRKRLRPIVLITGASQGIGAAIARTFARQLARVQLVLVARNAGNLRIIERSCAKLGAEVTTFVCDVSEAADVDDLHAKVENRFGALDVLINNAGVFSGALFTEMSVEEFDRLLAANLRSVFLMSRAFVPGMIARGTGDVFNMSSIAGLAAYPGGAGYCAAKFGVSGLSKVMRAELRSKGVRVCCVYPGATVSPSWKNSGIDEGRMMPADDVARAFFDIYRLSRRTDVEEIVLRPQSGDV